MLGYAGLGPKQEHAAKTFIGGNDTFVYQLAVASLIVTAYYPQPLTLCGILNSRTLSIVIVVSSLSHERPGEGKLTIRMIKLKIRFSLTDISWYLSVLGQY